MMLHSHQRMRSWSGSNVTFHSRCAGSTPCGSSAAPRSAGWSTSPTPARAHAVRRAVSSRRLCTLSSSGRCSEACAATAIGSSRRSSRLVSATARTRLADSNPPPPAQAPAAAPSAEPKLATAVHAVQSPATAKPAGDTGAGAAKLVDKLSAAGQLRAGFLLRVLHQGQIDLFELAFAKLLQMTLEQLRYVLYENGAAPVALACRAVGIDRCVFSTVFKLSRQCRGRQQSLTAQEQGDVEAIFKNFTKPDALNKVRSLPQLAN